ncbi:helix-turn-helix domain-containing protein [Amycolatopsis sp. GM8]|uniref:helix-turn-helix transcriptional regulator n=1 Tax=Amycolatopsis sp. GM8 TaxID=2896530 RepID=UPI001F1D9EFF|nr:helix-turn-helix domain-containing protein [Amycolatopsis sp. GM8]
MADDTDALLGPHVLRITPGHELARYLSPGASTRLRAGKLATRSQASLELLQPQHDYVVLIVLNGRVACRHGDRYLEAGPASLLAAGPHQRFEIEWVSGGMVRVVRIASDFVHARRSGFPPEGLVSFAPVVTSLRSINDTVTKSLMRFLTGAPESRLARPSEVVFVDWLLEHQPYAYSGREAARNPDDLAAFGKVLMHAEPFAGTEMGYYARQAGVSLAALVAAFEESGQLPHLYLRGVRLDCLARILSDGRCSSVGEAAEQCGFRDRATLYRWYHARFGEWPWDTWHRGALGDEC